MNCEKKDNFLIVNVLSISIMLIFIIYSYLFYSKANSLPAPFFYDSGDSFMDFFNVNWWSISGGAYTNWKSIYTPFNLWAAKNLVSDGCANMSSSVELRACDFELFITYLALLLIINVLLFYKIKKDIYTIFFISISMPMLYAIERGNYIIFAVTFASLYILYFNNNFISNGIILPLLIACKLYMAILVIPLLIIKGLKPAILAIINSVLLCIVFGLIINENNWMLIPTNIFTFQGSINSTEIIWASTTFSGVVTYINKFSDSFIITSVVLVFGLFVKIFVFLRLFIYIIEIINHKPDFIYILFLTLIAMLLVVSSIGYYGLIIIFPFYLYCDSRNMIDIKNKILLYLTLIPYVITMGSLKVQGSVSAYNATKITYARDLPVEYIFVPLFLFVLFYRLTSTNIFTKGKLNSNEN